MANNNVMFTAGMKAIENGGIDVDTDTLKLLLVASPADTGWDPEADKDSAVLADFDTAGGMTGVEHDGAYTRPTLASVAITSAAGVVKIDAADPVISSVAAGTYFMGGVLIYKHVTDDSDAIPICYIKADAQVPAAGADVTVQVATTGLWLKQQG